MTATVEVQELAASKRANSIAVWALLISILSAVFSTWMTYHTNAVAEQAQAALAFFDVDPEIDGSFYIKNLNHVAIEDVYFRYTLGGDEQPKDIVVGLIPGCSRVKLFLADGNHRRPDFIPTDLYIRDSYGRAWHKDKGGAISRNASPLQQGRKQILASPQPIEENC